MPDALYISRRVALNRVFWVVPVVLITALVIGSLLWNLESMEKQILQLATNRGKFVFDVVQTFRLWNSQHGGLYAPVTSKTKPNPYLIVPERDIRSPSGKLLTKINPAYMTRQVANLTKVGGNLVLHITSLLPLNPVNIPDAWEAQMLKSFEDGVDEVSTVVYGDQYLFRYMAPLITKQSCLKCHKKQGYKLGDVRGGISVTFPYKPIQDTFAEQKLNMVLAHFVAWVLLISLTLFILHRVWLQTQAKMREHDLNETLSNQLLELKQAREELIHSEKMATLGRLVAGFAHEINTPIGVSVAATSQTFESVSNIIRMLESEEVDEEKLVDYLETIEETTELSLSNLRKGSEMINRFKRTSIDQSNEQVRRFNVKELIDDVLFSLHNQFKRGHIEITVSCPQKMEINHSPGILDQILTNLLINSRIHGFENGTLPGEIIIKAALVDGFLHLDYSDTGKGIETINLPQLFEPFFTTQRSQGSSGLGLYICYNLVTSKLHGEISCNSDVGKGTQFRIRFPVHNKNNMTEINDENF
jgi:two-component system, NtrC family, sensor kinase